jgi:hypothetical protein
VKRLPVGWKQISDVFIPDGASHLGRFNFRWPGVIVWRWSCPNCQFILPAGIARRFTWLRSSAELTSVDFIARIAASQCTYGPAPTALPIGSRRSSPFGSLALQLRADRFSARSFSRSEGLDRMSQENSDAEECQKGGRKLIHGSATQSHASQGAFQKLPVNPVEDGLQHCRPLY